MKIKNIYGKKINVLGKPLEPDEIRELTTKEAKMSEIKKLITHKYIEEVK